MSKLGKKRKQWTEKGKINHKFQNAIKHCKPLEYKRKVEAEDDIV